MERYDHHEDGYDADVSVLNGTSTTEVWGDGNAANGCAPDVGVCSDANDVLLAGQSLILSSKVTFNDIGNIFDAGDKIQASFPVAITRGAYPDWPGSYMAGAVR